MPLKLGLTTQDIMSIIATDVHASRKPIQKKKLYLNDFLQISLWFGGKLSTVHNVTVDCCDKSIVWPQVCHLEAKVSSAEDDPCGFVIQPECLAAKMISGGGYK